MNDQELLRGARECTTIGGDCTGCPFDKHIGADGAYCSDLLVRALAERMEKLSERCSRYAEEIAVQQEREHREPLPERPKEERHG